MRDLRLAPYSHPTQIVLIDNDIDFLGNLSLQLEPNLPYLLFDDTHKALSYINQAAQSLAARHRFFDIVASGRASGDRSEGGVALNKDAIAREMHATHRFSQISMVMVDYAMPQLNGLEFCRLIDNPYIKKLLLTGVATETDAVAAFNSGVIDRFVRKSEPGVHQHLNHTIRDLQHRYMRDAFSVAGHVLGMESPQMLVDETIETLLGELRQRYEYVEYYLATEPSGFILLGANGSVYRLVVVDDRELGAYLDVLRSEGAPEECLALLAAGDQLLDPAVLREARASRVGGFGRWRSSLRSSTPIGESPRYRWAVFAYDDQDASPERPATSYAAYLEWHDAVSYSLM